MENIEHTDKKSISYPMLDYRQISILGLVIVVEFHFTDNLIFDK